MATIEELSDGEEEAFLTPRDDVDEDGVPAGDAGGGGADGAAEEPAVEEPAVEEPAVEEPAVEEPAVEEPPEDEEGPAVEEPPEEDEELSEEEPEEVLSPEVLAQRVEAAGELKARGNTAYAAGELEEALEAWGEALEQLPRKHEARAPLYANRAAVNLRFERWDAVVEDCTKALAIDDEYVKALSRRQQAHEAQEKFHDALKDIDRLLELGAPIPNLRAHRRKVEAQAKEADEKLKEEMLGKLKDVGNTLLGKFGLSLNNFQAVQDPKTGGYSINFKQ